ncbi:MAG: hypothetical protein ACF8AM_11450, partial [Rhodopirellula sp. JB055]|uniref:hypothetical protein n=1 Tax=Rhodopirellula sp. JB055 TaxID=3342846 RepID=UPI00370B6229
MTSSASSQTRRPFTMPGGAWPTIAATQTWELERFHKKIRIAKSQPEIQRRRRPGHDLAP